MTINATAVVAARALRRASPTSRACRAPNCKARRQVNIIKETPVARAPMCFLLAPLMRLTKDVILFTT